MGKIQASVGILTFNSETTLRRTLENVADFDDIVVCDGGSTDGTLDIAREFGAHVIAQNAAFKHADGRLKDFSGPRNQMLDHARHDWFLYIDSDETISEGLRQDIARIAQKPHEPGEPLVYKVPYSIITDGRVIKYSSNYPGYQHRFFNRKSGARFRKPVHERIYFDDSVVVGTLRHPWQVYGTRGGLLSYVHETRGYRAMEVKSLETLPWRAYLRWAVWHNLRTALGVLLKATRNYLLHGFKETAPISDELGRFVSPLILVWLHSVNRSKRIVRRLLNPKPVRVEPELVRLPALLKAMPEQAVFMDVGANVGAYTRAALKHLSAKRIYAFEPQPELVKELHRQFPGSTVEALAFSSRQGVAQFKVPEVAGVPYYTRGTLEQFKEERETGAQYFNVPLDTIDAYCKERGIVPGVIKIDVEGHEADVLEGARDVLKEHHPALIVEIEQRRLTRPVKEIFDTLEALGYRGEFFDPAAGAYRPLSEFNAEKHQNPSHHKTPHYIANIVFI